MNKQPICAYDYEGTLHCPTCAAARFELEAKTKTHGPLDANGVPAHARDTNGASIHRYGPLNGTCLCGAFFHEFARQ